jgi:large-conductance mechanosensitive channel
MDFNKDLKSFVVGNNILTTMAGVTIAFSTGIMIRSLVGDIILPTLYLLIRRGQPSVSGTFAPITRGNVDNYIKELVSWIFVIIFTFIIIEYLVKRMVLKQPPTVPAAPDKPAKKDDGAGGAVVGDGEHFYQPVYMR